MSYELFVKVFVSGIFVLLGLMFVDLTLSNEASLKWFRWVVTPYTVLYVLACAATIWYL